MKTHVLLSSQFSISIYLIIFSYSIASCRMKWNRKKHHPISSSFFFNFYLKRGTTYILEKVRTWYAHPGDCNNQNTHHRSRYICIYQSTCRLNIIYLRKLQTCCVLSVVMLHVCSTCIMHNTCTCSARTHQICIHFRVQL